MFLNYPIETPEAKQFWESRHKLNRIKAVCAFSLNRDNANDNLRRRGWAYAYRQRCLDLYQSIINKPDMKGIPLSDANDLWWNPNPLGTKPVTPPVLGAFIATTLGKVVTNSEIDYTINLKSDEVNQYLYVTLYDFSSDIKIKASRRPATLEVTDSDFPDNNTFRIMSKAYGSNDQVLVQLMDGKLITIHVISAAKP